VAFDEVELPGKEQKMGTPHVCFADEQQQQQQQHKTASNGSLNNNNNNKLDVGYNNTLGNGTPSPGGSLSVSPTPRYERNLGFFRQLSRRFGLRSQDDLVQSDDAASVATSRSGGGGGGGVSGVTLQEEDAHSSSTDSCSSGRGLNVAHQSRLELMSMSCASSETSSTLDIEEQQEQLQQQEQVQQPSKRKPISRASFSRLHRRSTSSLRRAFESLSLTSRSMSCSGPSPPPPAAHPPTIASGPPAAALPLKSALKSASNVELHRQQQLQQHHHQHHPMGRSSSSSCSSVAKSKVKPPPQRILRQPVSYTYLKGMSGLPTQRVPRSSVCCQYARR